MLELVAKVLKPSRRLVFIRIFAADYQPLVYEIVSDCLATCRLGLC